jgi:hypothetical protein
VKFDRTHRLGMQERLATRGCNTIRPRARQTRPYRLRAGKERTPQASEGRRASASGCSDQGAPTDRHHFPCNVAGHSAQHARFTACFREASDKESQGFAPSFPSPGSIANASSIRNRSHTFRALIVLGLGIRPSPTVCKTVWGDAPTYCAASAQFMPRGASELGRGPGRGGERPGLLPDHGAED